MTRIKQLFSLFAILLVSISINAQDNNIITHTVNTGQTLYSIPKLYGTTVEDIIRMNPESITTLWHTLCTLYSEGEQNSLEQS